MITYKVTVNDYGTIKWYNEEGKLHREDGPAVEYSYGTKYWYQNGKLHREDGPAIEHSNGVKEWFFNGVRMTEEDHSRANSFVKELSVSEIENLLGYRVKIIKR